MHPATTTDYAVRSGSGGEKWTSEVVFNEKQFKSSEHSKRTLAQEDAANIFRADVDVQEWWQRFPPSENHEQSRRFFETCHSDVKRAKN